MRKCFQDEVDLLQELRTNMSHYCSKVMGVSERVGTEILADVMHGKRPDLARLPETSEVTSLLNKVKKLAKFLRWVALTYMADVMPELHADQHEKWVEASAANLMGQTIEALCLNHWMIPKAAPTRSSTYTTQTSSFKKSSC